MNRHLQKFILVPMLLICLCVGLFAPIVVVARDSFAPSWLKEGSYVKYVASYGENSDVYVFDVGDSRFAGLNYMWAPVGFDWVLCSSASLMWRCVDVNSSMAKLDVTFDYVGVRLDHYEGDELIRTDLKGKAFQRTGIAYVDLYTRSVYNADGALLGTTHLWLPANPSDGQKIVVWDVEPKTVTLPVSIITVDTIQGVQDGFMFMDMFRLKDTETNRPPFMSMFYDLDTGLAVDGLFDWDPVMAVVGVGGAGFNEFAATNIDLGPARSSINWITILQYAILPIAVILFIVAFIVRNKKKKK